MICRRILKIIFIGLVERVGVIIKEGLQEVKKNQNSLQNIPDRERSLSRISLSRGGPKDLLLISKGLLCIKEIYEDLVSILQYHSSPNLLNLILDNLNIEYKIFLNIK